MERKNRESWTHFESNALVRFWKHETVKALKGSSTFLIIGLLIAVAALPVKASTPTLADQLNASISTVDWVHPQSWAIPHFTLIFTGQNIYDTVLPAIPDFKTLIQTKRIAELDDINSSFLNQLVAQAMDNQTMVGHWPSVDPHLMLVYWKYMVSAYRYATELGSNTSKWDRDLAYEEFLRCWQADPDFLWFDAGNGIPTGPRVATGTTMKTPKFYRSFSNSTK